MFKNQAKLLIEAIFYIVWTLVKTLWQPIYTSTIKIAFISTMLFLLLKFFPHNIEYLQSLNWYSCVTIIVAYRLITVKYDDFDVEEESKQIQTDEITLPEDEILDDSNLEDLPPPAPNVKPKGKRNDNSSVRE